jgi:hypothetical protein
LRHVASSIAIWIDWQEFVRRSRERSAEISANGARSDEKLKALIDEIQKKETISRPPDTVSRA